MDLIFPNRELCIVPSVTTFDQSIPNKSYSFDANIVSQLLSLICSSKSRQMLLTWLVYGTLPFLHAMGIITLMGVMQVTHIVFFIRLLLPHQKDKEMVLYTHDDNNKNDRL